MASSSTETDSDVTISDVPVHEIPPPILHAEEEDAMEQCSKMDVVHKIPCIIDAQKEEVAMEQSKKEVEVEVAKSLKDIPGIHVQDWRGFASKRIDGRTDKVSIYHATSGIVQ